MSELKRYDVEINGWPTTVQLTEAEARERGLTETTAPAKAKARPAANKARTPANKAAAGESDQGE